MENNNNIVIYDDLSKDYHKINAWNIESSFPVTVINDYNRSIIENIVVIEIVFPGTQGKNELTESLFENYNKFIKKLIFSLHEKSYLIKTEFKLSLKSRIRSYKGIIDSKDLDENEFIQIETSVKDDLTIIAALAKLSNENIDNLIDSFSSQSTCCIIAPNNLNIYSEHFLKSISIDFMTHTEMSNIDYFRLASEICPKGGIIYRMGGDGGDQEISLQIFSSKERKEYFIAKAEKILQEFN